MRVFKSLNGLFPKNDIFYYNKKYVADILILKEYKVLMEERPPKKFIRAQEALDRDRRERVPEPAQ
jgi:hypothetical protein